MFAKLGKLKPYFIILEVSLLATAIIYGWFWFKNPEKLQYVYQNWDGPNYVIIAKSFYNPKAIDKVNYIKWLKPDYFACHFPLYPTLIRLFSFIGYFRSMLFTSWLFSVLMLFVFYRLVEKFKFSAHPLLLTLPFIFLPPRWFIVSHVGSSEPVFMFFILLMFYFFLGKKYFLASLAGFFASLTRFQGLLFFAGIEVYLLGEFLLCQGTTPGVARLSAEAEAKAERDSPGVKELARRLPRMTGAKAKEYLTKAATFLLMPLAVLLVFTWYHLQYHDFWVFFKAMRDWQHLAWPPFQGFSYPKWSLPTFWLEEKVYVYLIFATALFKLLVDKKYFFATLGLVYFLPLLALVHVDLSRYILPIAPLVFLAYEKIITKKYFLAGLLLILPSIFAYSIGFMGWNLAP